MLENDSGGRVLEFLGSASNSFLNPEIVWSFVVEEHDLDKMMSLLLALINSWLKDPVDFLSKMK